MLNVSLRTRLFAAYVLAVVAALALVTLLTGRGERSWLVERDTESLERIARYAAGGLAEGFPSARDWQGEAEALQAGLGYRATLIDSMGRVVGDSEVSRERLATVENHADRPEVRGALAGRTGHAVRKSATVSVDFLYLGVPVRGVPGVAVLRLAKPLHEIARLNASLFRISAGAAGLTLLVLSLLFFWLSGRQAARVAELERVAHRLGQGDLAARARELPADELGRLGRAMNLMAAELRGRVEALARERDEREHILAHMSDGVALIDAAGRILHANRSLAAILGAPLPPAAGTPFEEFARSPELVELLRSTRAGGRPVEQEIRLWAPRPRVVRASATRLGSDGRDAVLLVLHDLTEIEQLNRVRQDFVANVSHELRTPLTSVRGYAETLLEGGLEDVANREGFVRTIREQAGRLEAMIDDLLSLAQLERPGARAKRELFDLRESAERQVAAFRLRAERAGLGLAVEAGGPVPVQADRGLIDQVLANLIDNAVKYTERGGVTVRLGTTAEAVWCEVEDTGSGIPDEDLPRVFERFYRVDKARSREKGGTGLGLAIVKHVLALHGGSVSARSALGQGSVFRFEIPAGTDFSSR
jgi:two-component system phosphate regulon sensor histidine kinase PhoR